MKKEEIKIKNLRKEGKSLQKISEITKRSYSFINEVLQKKEEIKDYNNYIAICKKTGKTFKDVRNLSGCITNHLKNIYPNLKHPSNYEKRKFKRENGFYWHEQFFNIKTKEDNEYKKCPYCNWKTKDVYNKSGSFTNHLLKVHALSIIEHLKKYPQDETILKSSYKKEKNKKETENNPDKHIKCKICGKKFKKITSTHLKKHNLTPTEYREKYQETTLSQENLNKIIKEYESNLKFTKNNFSSKGQIEIKDFIESNNIEVELNNKKILNGIEIDIFLPQYNIAFEYDGLFYHSQIGGKKDKNYHFNKSKMCYEKGIKLIHIFEDEWNEKKDLVKDKINHILDLKKENKIYGRKCLIRKIDNIDKKEFLDDNHIQGNDNSNFNLGAFYNENLIAVMSFDNKRSMNSGNKNKNLYELKRFCTKRNYQVIGIAGKLLNYFIKNNKTKEIISFADRRWNFNPKENLYTKLGFEFDQFINPDYYYLFNYKRRLHKFGYGKESIKKKFPNQYDVNKTEWEMMQEIGYDRIWDCGKIKYKLTLY